MKIFAIETSCDETALALIDATGGLKNPHFKIFKNLVASQIKIHQPYGGIVPNLAKREHLKNLPILYNKLKSKKLKFKTDLIVVTVGPGLEPALWTGINFAKKLDLGLRLTADAKQQRIIGVSHLEGHLYSFLLQQKTINSQKLFPAIALLISGGHTILIKMDSLAKYKKLGETRDDAVGEAFDKVARLLNLPYPGGPEIEKLAKYGSSTSINFPRPMINQKNYDFSFSGLKTAVLYYLRDHKLKGLDLKFKASKANVAASFQQAAFDVLIKKTLRAAKEFRTKSIILSGGVAANKTLKKEFQKAIKIQFPNQQIPRLLITRFPTDNAAMIAVAGYINYWRKKKRRLLVQGNLTI